MRILAFAAALALFGAPLMVAPAFADGIERPRRAAPAPRPRAARPAPAPVPLAPAPAPAGPETVTLSDSFFAQSSGGVGADVATHVVIHHNVNTVVRGGGASASAFAFTSARARAGGFGGGHRGGGCACR